MSERDKDMGRLAAREEQKEHSGDSDTSADQDSESTDTSTDSSSATTVSESGSSEPASINVKDREATLFAYLPSQLDQQVETACQSVSLTYQRESGEKLGKNRYLYPIVLMVGADNAVDLSYSEIRSLVDRIDEIDDI